MGLGWDGGAARRSGAEQVGRRRRRLPLPRSWGVVVAEYFILPHS